MLSLNKLLSADDSIFVTYKNRKPNPGKCKIIAIDYDRRVLTISNGAVMLFPSFNEVKLYSNEVICSHVNGSCPIGCKHSKLHEPLVDFYDDYDDDNPIACSAKKVKCGWRTDEPMCICKPV